VVKKLQKVGNSYAIILDRPTLETAGVLPREGEEVDVNSGSGWITLVPVSPQFISPDELKEHLDRIGKERGAVLKRLAD
jgi:antitoxin component of MazEF toxin-antitoxin module